MAATGAGLPTRQRLADLTEYAIQGAWPRDAEDCTACFGLAGGRCSECAAQQADAVALSRVSETINESATDAGALAVFLAGLADMAGLPDSFAKFLVMDALAARNPGAVRQECLAPGQCARNRGGDQAMTDIYRQILAGIEEAAQVRGESGETE
jgi:hypothetical protein